MKTKPTKEEKEILYSFEIGEWVPVADPSERKKELAEYARNTLRKDKKLNIRISERDLIELQRKVVKEGLPYQTYVSSIIHKFVNGTPVEGATKEGPTKRSSRDNKVPASR
jgi:predicted DNA binding CopG/RHH family protein